MKIAIYSKNRKCYNQIQVKIFCGDEIPGVPEDGIVGSTVRRVTDGVTEKVTEKVTGKFYSNVNHARRAIKV